MLPTRTAGHLPKFNAKPFERTLKAKATNGRVGILIRFLRGTHHKWHTAGTNTIALTKITKECIRYCTPMPFEQHKSKNCPHFALHCGRPRRPLVWAVLSHMNSKQSKLPLSSSIITTHRVLQQSSTSTSASLVTALLIQFWGYLPRYVRIECYNKVYAPAHLSASLEHCWCILRPPPYDCTCPMSKNKTINHFNELCS